MLRRDWSLPEVGDMGVKVVKIYKLADSYKINSWDIIHSMVTEVNHNVSYI